MALCKNCNHQIVLDKGKYKHRKQEFGMNSRRFFYLCGSRITSNKKLELFKKRWKEKYKKKYSGKNPICGCNKPEVNTTNEVSGNSSHD